MGTPTRPTDWVEREYTFKSDDGKKTYHGKQFGKAGRMPRAVECTKVTLTVQNAALRSASLLDLNGNVGGALKVAAPGGELKLFLPRNAMSVILQSE
jgi:hypothetical protein